MSRRYPISRPRPVVYQDDDDDEYSNQYLDPEIQYYNDRSTSLSESHHHGQQLRRPPPPPFTMSMGDRGHFHNVPNPVSPSQTSSLRHGTPGGSPLLTPADSSSLSVNYLPTKFGAGLVSRKRYGKDLPGVRKQGGGREAFKANESRMPGANDEDYDGVQGTWFGHGPNKPALRWTKFKWIMFVGNILLTIYSLISLIFCLLTWFLVWDRADVVRVGNKDELIVSTVAACVGIVTSLVGWAGILLNNRGFLAWYTFLLWICFAFLLTPGYITYKKRTFNLEGKLNKQWSQNLGASGRLAIQNQLECCGYFSPFVLATVSQTCYARTVLPGCKGLYMRYERVILQRWFTVAFGLVPLHLFVMISALLCSNHVTYRFGKGMTPKAYRLDLSSMAVIMDNYANQLAEQYGNDVASEILARSRSNLQLDALPNVPYEHRH